jgi:hypothetical protein
MLSSGREDAALSVTRAELHALVDQIPEADLAVTRKLLTALAADWDVSPVESEGELTAACKQDLKEAILRLDAGEDGIPHSEVLREFGLK